MPIYEYQCKNCNHCFEMIQKISDPPAKQCPQCFSESLEKLVSAAGFQLKGTGWYETDFKNKSSGPKASDKNNATDKKEKSTSSDATQTKDSSSKSQNKDK